MNDHPMQTMLERTIVIVFFALILWASYVMFIQAPECSIQYGRDIGQWPDQAEDPVGYNAAIDQTLALIEERRETGCR